MKRHVEKILTLTSNNLNQAVQEVREKFPAERVVRLSVDDNVYWMKQAEQPGSLRKRLRKGDGEAALQREIENLSALSERGIPVPKMVETGQDYLVLEDGGLTINDLYLLDSYDPQRDVAAYYAVGQALAKLHKQGLALKRGHPRDYCWDTHTVRFIDLETKLSALVPGGNGRKNIYNFVFFTLRIGYKVDRDAYAEARAFLEGYSSERCDETRQTLEATNRWARRRWFWAACNFAIGLMTPPERFAKAKSTALSIMMLRHFQPYPQRYEPDAPQ